MNTALYVILGVLTLVLMAVMLKQTWLYVTTGFIEHLYQAAFYACVAGVCTITLECMEV